MRNKHYLLLCALAAALQCLPAAAQTDVHDWKNVQSVATDTELWVKTVHHSYTGNLVSVSDDELVIVRRRRVLIFIPIEHEYRFRRSQVRAVRFGRRALSQLAGAAIGVGAGVGLGLAAEATARNQREDGHLLAVALGMLGGAMGATVGEDHPFLKGKAIYVAP
jgi:hypothetical protein